MSTPSTLSNMKIRTKLMLLLLLFGLLPLLVTAPIVLLKVKSILVHTIGGAQAFATYDSIQTTLFASLAIAAGVIAVVGYLIGDASARRIGAIKEALATLANKHIPDIPNLDDKDEIGDMARSMAEIKEATVLNADFTGQVDAINKSQAVIHFNLDGTIITANDNFLNTLGYTLDEIRGKHHSMFAEPAYAVSAEYITFWEKLNRGEYDANEYMRIGKGGKEIWIQASYNPIRDVDGNLVKVVKYATDITDQVVKNADFTGQVEAISKSQAVIQFNLDGTIITANENFLQTLGYTLEEIQGKHHSMFAEPTYAASPEYAAFWDKLNRGEYDANEYMRIGKGGKEVWIQASYNPIRDVNGRLVKVVKYATDITEQVTQRAFNQRFRTMVNELSLPVMLCDTDFNITYANEVSINTLRTIEHLLPIKADELIGANIDIFHKNPAHQRGLLSSLGDRSHSAEFKIGDEWLSLNASIIKDANGNFDGAFIDWRVVTKDKALNEETANKQAMIDELSTPMMLCDKDFTITYINKASRIALKKLESALPVSVDQLVGTSIDVFHQDPSHQRKMLADPSKLPHQAKFPIGGEWLSLNACSMPLKDGEFNGAFVDWNIVTEEVRNEEMVKLAQEKIQELIESANNGDLEKRINADEFEGFYRDLANSMNGLMDTMVEPINRSINTLQDFAQGDLTQEMEGNYSGSFAEIQNAINSTIERLRDIVINIIESAGSVNSAAGEISAGSSDLAQRTQQQASSLEETAASMEEITGTVRQNSENSKNANNLAIDARGVAENGGKVVSQAVEAMERIESSSQKISEIIGVIDEIAFQTNLLALNAAVEAARAGEAGKGFAVVASEVRSLAGRSASASKEIKSLIVESGTQVKAGAELVNKAGSTLQEIVTSVTGVADLIADIATASAEQSTGIDEVSAAVTQMDEVTQQNAALVEETEAAAGSLVEQSRSLDDMMQFFKVEDGDNHQPPPSIKSAPAVKRTQSNNAPAKSSNGVKNGSTIPAAEVIKSVSNGAADGGNYDGDWEEF